LGGDVNRSASVVSAMSVPSVVSLAYSVLSDLPPMPLTYRLPFLGSCDS